MQKKVIIALLVSIPLLFGAFYFIVDSPSSKELDAEKIAVYVALSQDSIISRNPWMYNEVKQRSLRIESKYKFEEKNELEYLMLMSMKSLSNDENIINSSFIRFYQSERENILKMYSKSNNRR